MSLRKSIQLSIAAALLTIPANNLCAAAADKAERPHMDLAFCIDTTGSMQREIDMVKAKTKDLVAKLSTGKPAPIVRVGLVAYRDRGDEYVTKVFQFSDDIDQVVKDISGLKAMGGGDAPESVNEALHVAVTDLKWDENKHTAKLLFLIGDAGPHQYPHDFKWEDESKKAIASGIQINTIACSGLQQFPNAEGTDVFRQIAKLTDGRFDTLAYRQEVADGSGKRSTIVTSGGALYKVDGAAGDWKSAVASKRMEKISPAAPASLAIVDSRPSFGDLPRSRAVGRAVSSAAPMAESRADSNLDEIVLGAAKAKAAKQLKVQY